MSHLLLATDLRVIAGVLAALLLGAVELGFRLGSAHRSDSDDRAGVALTTIIGALLGLLALLLGFTFSMAVSRYDARRRLVVEDANAIGTAFLRTQFLPEAERAASAQRLRRYVDVRLELHQAASEGTPTAAGLDETKRLQDELWALAVGAADAQQQSLPIQLYVASLNQLIDVHGERYAVVLASLPEAVLHLLFVMTVGTGGLIGYACGRVGQRYGVSTTIFAMLIVGVIMVIMDLDRPRHGLIRVSQQPIVDLQQALKP